MGVLGTFLGVSGELVGVLGTFLGVSGELVGVLGTFLGEFVGEEWLEVDDEGGSVADIVVFCGVMFV